MLSRISNSFILGPIKRRCAVKALSTESSANVGTTPSLTYESSEMGYKATHDVFNQSSSLENFNLYESDPGIKLVVEAALSKDSSSSKRQAAVDTLTVFGAQAGSSEMMKQAELAEKNRPVLRQFDQQGRRIDVIDYHDAYHTLKDFSLSAGAAGLGYQNEGEDAKIASAHVVRAGLICMANQMEPGHCCPVVMTAAAVPALEGQPGMEEWVRKLAVPAYDPRNVPMMEKEAVTVGMSMTEKQGGSDVRANTTYAVPLHPSQTGPGEMYALTGHKWFTSAPMSDAFLTLAYAEGAPSAPSCFLVPRWLPDGSRNRGFQVMRLKDKLADRANASSEVEYHQAVGFLVGEPGRGVKQILEMVTSTRMDCALGSAGGTRRALQQALQHVSGREAFGATLLEQPLMRNLLADLSVEAEAQSVMSMAMADLWDRFRRCKSPKERAAMAPVLRVGIAVAKYYVTKRAPNVAYECMEVFGGNGFTEDFPMARLFRHSPLNAIWEGSGNVICLDLLRAAPALPAFVAHMESVSGTVQDARVQALLESLKKDIPGLNLSDPLSQAGARNVADRLGLALAASSLLQYESPVAAAFLSSRLAPMGPGGPILTGVRTPAFNFGSHVYSEGLVHFLLERCMAR